VAEEKQQLIFDAFQQADGSTSREFGGTGLGLSISQELAKYMGGKITLSSVAEQGSQFSLIIPMQQPDTAHSKKETDYNIPSLPLPDQQVEKSKRIFLESGSKAKPGKPT